MHGVNFELIVISGRKCAPRCPIQLLMHAHAQVPGAHAPASRACDHGAHTSHGFASSGSSLESCLSFPFLTSAPTSSSCPHPRVLASRCNPRSMGVVPIITRITSGIVSGLSLGFGKTIMSNPWLLGGASVNPAFYLAPLTLTTTDMAPVRYSGQGIIAQLIPIFMFLGGGFAGGVIKGYKTKAREQAPRMHAPHVLLELSRPLLISQTSEYYG